MQTHRYRCDNPKPESVSRTIPQEPPGPRGVFLLGHIAPLLGRPLSFLDECVSSYGDVVRLRALGSDICVINDPVLIERILVTNKSNFIKPRMATSAVFGNGLLSSEGEFWRRQRRMIQPAFHHDRLVAYTQETAERTRAAMTEWRNGDVRDMLEVMSLLTLSIISSALFGATLSHAELQDIRRTCELALRRSIVRQGLLPILGRLPFPSNVRFARTIARFNAILHDIIEARQTIDVKRDDLLTILLDGTDTEKGMTAGQVRDEAATMLMAGHETTATALTWIWYLLSQNPDSERRLEAELDEVLAGRAPTPDDIPNLQFTSNVVKESMRIIPTGWIMARTVVNDCTLGGYAIPKKTVLLLSQWTVHRDRRWFDQPLTFNPDRWRDGLEQRIPKFAYFPFGGGAHRCIGDALTMMETTLVVATMAQRVRFRMADRHSVAFLPLLTLRPKFGMKMVVEMR